MENQNKLFITSDLHFYHKNIIKYCNRPFEDIYQMNEKILSEFDNLPTNSTILNLGDLYISSKAKFEDVKYVVDRMKYNGKKLIILLGNHDRTTPRYLKTKATAKEIFIDLGFDEVITEPFEKDGMIFCHEPVYIKNTPLVCGHIHNEDITSDYFCHEYENFAMTKRVKKIVNPRFYFNACWDKHHRILPYEEIISYFSNLRKTIS